MRVLNTLTQEEIHMTVPNALRAWQQCRNRGEEGKSLVLLDEAGFVIPGSEISDWVGKYAEQMSKQWLVYGVVEATETEPAYILYPTGWDDQGELEMGLICTKLDWPRRKINFLVITPEGKPLHSQD